MMALAFPDCDARINPEGEYLDVSTGGCVQKLPEGGNVLGPWVAIKFIGSGSVITVSNQSSPDTDPPNVAVIKSFEFGSEDGMQVRIVIHDQQGGSFVTFMEHLFKHYVCLKDQHPSTILMQYQWGWVKSGCKHPLPNAKSLCRYAIVKGIETNFTEGKFIAEITGVDNGTNMLEGNSDRIFGGDGSEGMCLRDALEELLMRSDPPNVGKVSLKRSQGGTDVDCAFEFGCEGEGKKEKFKGPKGKWMANGQDKLRTAVRWLEGWRTAKKKGWKPGYNSLEPNGEIIFWEDGSPKCNCKNTSFWESNCIGKYIVNGGKSSPVIEFNPKIGWNFANLVSGGGATGNKTVSPLDAEGSKTPGRRECATLTRSANPGAGLNLQTTSTPNHDDIFNKTGQDKKHKADVEALKILKVMPESITADLVIVGDPTILPPDSSLGRNVHIKFINPYHLMGGKGCSDWTVEPTINEVLTNIAWMVRSITHKIESGNYTTTLNLWLAAPGVTGDAGQPIGLWCDGWKPKIC